MCSPNGCSRPRQGGILTCRGRRRSQFLKRAHRNTLWHRESGHRSTQGAALHLVGGSPRHRDSKEEFSIDKAVADVRAKIVARTEAMGCRIEAMDAFIAATADTHRQILVARNASHFEPASIHSICIRKSFLFQVAPFHPLEETL